MQRRPLIQERPVYSRALNYQTEESRIAGSDPIRKISDVENESTTTSTDNVNSSLASSLIATKADSRDVMDLMNEIKEQVLNGTAEIFGDFYSSLDGKLEYLPEGSATELLSYLTNLTKDVHKAQERELQRYMDELERRFVRPLEDFAFSDVPLFEANKPAPTSGRTRNGGTLSRENLVLLGANSTLASARKMKSRDILRNFNIAPFYYTIALSLRWLRKASSPPIYLTSLMKSMASMVKSSEMQTTSCNNQIVAPGDELQVGWKRIGEISAKGSIAKKWAILQRSAEIWSYFSSFYLKDRRITTQFNSGKWSEELFREERSKLGQELVQNLLRLGPTFIKVGQLFSTRLDIIPKEYINELKQLQDNVPPFSGDLAVSIVEQELGRPIDELFDEFNRTSLAAASLGQVHVARKGKKLLAVKIQRQYLRELFEVDLGQLRQVAAFADAMDFTAEGGLLDRNTQRDWLSIFEESKRLLYEEIDYLTEMENCKKFQNNFDSYKFPHIRAPNTFPEYTTSKVLTMEYVPGVKVTDKEKIIQLGLDPVEVSTKIAESFLEQLCRHGFFHSDPHPGNVAVERAEDGEARLIFYDFGMMDSFDEVKRKGLVDLFFAVYYDADVKEACSALERLGILRTGPDIDRIAVERVGQDFIDRFQATLQQNAEWENELSPEERARINRQRRKQLGEEFLSLNRDSPFIFPPTWTFIFRAFFSIDGIGKTLNPKFDLTRLTLPYLKELLDLKDGNALKTTLLRIGKRLGLRPVDICQAVTQPRKTAKIEDVITRLERGDLKLRVRTQEVERELERSKIIQRGTLEAVLSGVLLQVAVVLAPVGGSKRWARPVMKALFGASAFLAARLPIMFLRLRRFDKYYERYGVRQR